MKTLNGMIYALLLCSIALNIAQYNGTLSSPQMVELQPTDQQQLASALGGM